jgi:hypothetical protein
VLAAAAVCWTIAGTAGALPRFSVQKGEGCVLCHANPSGAGLRNLYGMDAFGARELSAKRGNAAAAEIGEAIRVGGDIRTQAYFYRDDEGATTTTRHGFFAMQADLYAFWELTDGASVYLEQDVLRRTSETFGMFAPKSGRFYLKFGSFLPNYGLKIDDHTAFIRGGSVRLPLRDGMLWAPNYADTGVEVALRLAGGEATAGVFNGGPNPLGPDARDSNDKAFLLRAESHGKLGGLGAHGGASMYTDRSPSVDGRMVMVGAFGGVGTSEWTLTAAADVAGDYLPSAALDSGASSLFAFAEAVARAARGVYVLARLEHMDPDLDAASGRVWRASVGAEAFPFPHVELKPLLRLQTDSRVVRDAGAGTETAAPDVLELLLQTHWWF